VAEELRHAAVKQVPGIILTEAAVKLGGEGMAACVECHVVQVEAHAMCQCACKGCVARAGCVFMGDRPGLRARVLSWKALRQTACLFLLPSNSS